MVLILTKRGKFGVDLKAKATLDENNQNLVLDFKKK